jgi:hemin uptake protein HemP
VVQAFAVAGVRPGRAAPELDWPIAALANRHFVDLFSQEIGAFDGGLVRIDAEPFCHDQATRSGKWPAGQSVIRRHEAERIKVSELLQAEREVILEHDGQDYRLKITANGKLILTK